MAVSRSEETAAGDPGESLEELFLALESPLLSYAFRLTGNAELAEDIVQEAFMRLHAHFATVEKPRLWLYRTAHNLAANHHRQSAKIIPIQQNEDLDTPEHELSDLKPLPDEQIARLESIGIVRLSLQSLDERARELVRLKFEENLSYKEISNRTGLTVGNVGYILHHAIKELADELARNGMLP